MLRALDNFILRFEEAFFAFRNPQNRDEEFRSGIAVGKSVAFAQIRQQFDNYDPFKIDNQHFKMGYYYAADQAKKVMPNDEDNSVD